MTCQHLPWELLPVQCAACARAVGRSSKCESELRPVHGVHDATRNGKSLPPEVDADFESPSELSRENRSSSEAWRARCVGLLPARAHGAHGEVWRPVHRAGGTHTHQVSGRVRQSPPVYLSVCLSARSLAFPLPRCAVTAACASDRGHWLLVVVLHRGHGRCIIKALIPFTCSPLYVSLISQFFLLTSTAHTHLPTCFCAPRRLL